MKLKIFKDATQVTYGYNLDSEDEKIGIVLTSDGYASPEEIVNELTTLSEALAEGLKNIEKDETC